MTMKLKVLHGKLQNSHGENAGAEVRVRGPVFVIGSDADCSMCCRSRSISPHHCEIRMEERGAVVRDLYSGSGTFVNDERVDYERPLRAGDRLRIGRLEFTVVVEQTSAPTVDERSRATRAKPDAVAEYISNLLVEEDEKERAQRLEDPARREFHLEKPAQAAQKTAAEPKAAETAAKKIARPAKKPPAKLPAPPPMSANSTVEAAEETLNRVYFKGKR